MKIFQLWDFEILQFLDMTVKILKISLLKRKGHGFLHPFLVIGGWKLVYMLYIGCIFLKVFSLHLTSPKRWSQGVKRGKVALTWLNEIDKVFILSYITDIYFTITQNTKINRIFVSFFITDIHFTITQDFYSIL